MEEEKEISIELDCPPGATRPDDLLPGVLNETGLVPEDFECTSKVFGNWEFVLINKEKEKVYSEAKPTIKQRVTDLYNSGRIRYGSW